MSTNGAYQELLVVDLRSDTQSKPTAAMREAMAAATANDDIYREDATIHQLQDQVAEMFGKEAALFVPSGTMANLLGIACQCPARGMEVIMGDKSHTFLREQGSLSQLAGLHIHPLPTLPDGTFDLELLEDSIKSQSDVHCPLTAIVSVENTHNHCGGKIIPLEFMERLRKVANKHNLLIHLDGSRLLNASVALDVSCADLAKHADSVNFCFSKGVGAPIGSALIGSRELIERAIRMRKALGGGWRKAGCLAAAALVALGDARERFIKDHEHAKIFARFLARDGSGVLHVDVDGVHTNIIMAKVAKSGINAEHIVRRLAEVTEKEKLERNGVAVVVKCHNMGKNLVRFVMYGDISREDAEKAAEKVNYVLREF